MTKINFGCIENYILFGGGKFLLHVAKRLKSDGFEVVVFSAARHLNEDIDGKALKTLLDENVITYYKSEDINKDIRVLDYISERTIALSFGAAWIFKKSFIDCFHGRLINFHGTRLPQNRGGGGFTWQILRKNKLGFCLMHQVDYGVDTGNIIKYREFLYPHLCKTPADFMEYHIKENISFFEEFLNEIRFEKDFECISQPEYLSIY